MLGGGAEANDLMAEVDSGFWESPRRGLEHYNSAPLRYNSNNISKGCEVNLPNKLDKLSESEKKKVIENLVKVQNNGMLEVNVSRTTSVASQLLELDALGATPADMGDSFLESSKLIPRLMIAILVVGTRGDVQPFIAVAKRLQEFGHQVRLATHVNFRNFVKSTGVDFYPLGGDPRILAAILARSKNFLLPGLGDLSIQRKQMKEIIDSLLPACTEPDMDSGAPFRAQAIIANPPAYGHAHVAEALGVPLHFFFTMPWTQANK